MQDKSANPIELYLAEVAAEKKQKEQVAIASGNLSEELVDNENRHFVIVMVLLVVGCLGGIAVGMGALASTLQIALLVFPVMTTLSLLLAVQPMKYIIVSATIACIIDVIIIAINLL